ncbi:MAG: DUF2948 family protein [Pseudomonadota bacterium]
MDKTQIKKTEPSRLGHEFSSKPISIIGIDRDDLNVISSLCQDALVVVQDLMFDAQENIFIIVLNRYCHECEQADDHKMERVLCALYIENVTKVAKRGFLRAKQKKILYILNLDFDPQEEMSLTINFAGDCAIKLSIDALKITMRDLSEHWPTFNKPQHDKSHDQ